MATEQQLLDYVHGLPEIYREILSAFPRIEPNRRKGYGLAFQSLLSDFEGRDLKFGLGEVIQACQQLQQRQLVEIKHRIFVHPTEAGERLIAALTGQHASVARVPELPVPPA
jgi:hypothetical protein